MTHLPHISVRARFGPSRGLVGSESKVVYRILAYMPEPSLQSSYSCAPPGSLLNVPLSVLAVADLIFVSKGTNISLALASWRLQALRL